MVIHRVYPDEEFQSAILEAAKQFHEKLDAAMEKYNEAMSSEVMRLHEVPLVEVINKEQWGI